jgi:hypothetical protein
MICEKLNKLINLMIFAIMGGKMKKMHPVLTYILYYTLYFKICFCWHTNEFSLRILNFRP